MEQELLLKLDKISSLFGESLWLKSLVVVVLSIFIAWVLQWFVRRGIRKLTRHTSTHLDNQIITLIHRPIFWTVMLFGFYIAAQVAGLSQQVIDVLHSSVLSILIFLWMMFALRASRVIVLAISRHGTETSIIRPQTMPLFTNLAAVIVIALAVYFIFHSWNIDMTAWLASAGIAGIAIGFAAKDTLANLFSGVFILADSPYKLGDYVVLDNNERGKITHIGIRSTRLITRDDVEVTVPNSIMGNSKIINESGGPHTKYRIRVKVGVAYGSDIDEVEKVLMDVANTDTDVCSSPEPRVRFRLFGASSLDFELLCWVTEPEHRGRVLHQLNSAIYKAFNREGIVIPFAQQDIYIKEMPQSIGYRNDYKHEPG